MCEPVLQAGQHAELNAALEAAASAAAPVYVLFPGAGAVSVSEAACASEHRRCLEQTPLPVVDTSSGPPAASSAGEPSKETGVPDHGCCPPQALESDTDHTSAVDAVASGTLSLLAPAHAARSPHACGSHPAYWLIALDGTWQQANEIFQVPHLSACSRQPCKPCTTHASLPELFVLLAVPMLRSVQCVACRVACKALEPVPAHTCRSCVVIIGIHGETLHRGSRQQRAVCWRAPPAWSSRMSTAQPQLLRCTATSTKQQQARSRAASQGSALALSRASMRPSGWSQCAAA